MHLPPFKVSPGAPVRPSCGSRRLSRGGTSPTRRDPSTSPICTSDLETPRQHLICAGTVLHSYRPTNQAAKENPSRRNLLRSTRRVPRVDPPKGSPRHALETPRVSRRVLHLPGALQSGQDSANPRSLREENIPSRGVQHHHHCPVDMPKESQESFVHRHQNGTELGFSTKLSASTLLFPTLPQTEPSSQVSRPKHLRALHSQVISAKQGGTGLPQPRN